MGLVSPCYRFLTVRRVVQQEMRGVRPLYKDTPFFYVEIYNNPTESLFSQVLIEKIIIV